MAVERVELPEDAVEFVRQCVAAGGYDDATAVVVAGLRLLEQRDSEERQKLERMRAEVQKGMDDLENGRYIEISSDEDLDALFDQVDREAQMIAGGKKPSVSATETQ